MKLRYIAKLKELFLFLLLNIFLRRSLAIKILNVKVSSLSTKDFLLEKRKTTYQGVTFRRKFLKIREILSNCFSFLIAVRVSAIYRTIIIISTDGDNLNRHECEFTQRCIAVMLFCLCR